MRSPRGCGGRVPADARDVRDGRHGDHDARGDQVHGMTANAFMSVSLSPPLILISVDRRARMNGLLHEGARYGVSVLEERQSRHLRPVRGPGGRRCAGAGVRDRPRHAARRGRARASRRAGRPLATGAATTRCSSGGSSTSATATARRCSSTAAATSASCTTRTSSPRLPDELLRPILAAGVERVFADGDDADAPRRAGRHALPGRRGHGRGRRRGRVGAARRRRAGRRDRGARTRRRPHRRHRRRSDRCAASRCRREAVFHALEADPRAAWRCSSVLASRFRENA